MYFQFGNMHFYEFEVKDQKWNLLFVNPLLKLDSIIYDRYFTEQLNTMKKGDIG